MVENKSELKLKTFNGVIYINIIKYIEYDG